MSMRLITGLVCCAFALTACLGTVQQIATPAVTTKVTAAPVSTVSPTTRPVPPTSSPTATALPIIPTPTPSAQTLAMAKWQASPHGNTYDLGKGPNTYCARCHSPQNWDPASKVDAPPNCVSCKFATDATVRIAQSNRLVAKADWKNVGCEVCHRVKGGDVQPEIAWLNKTSGEYEPVDNATNLCAKCHTDTDVLRHRRDLGNQAHVGFQCTRCHDAHTTRASCESPQCHPNPSALPGHDKAHASVRCVACHDASGLMPGLDSGTKTWVTFRTTELLGRKSTQPYLSHNLQKRVDCARCHFAGNPFGLSEKKTP